MTIEFKIEENLTEKDIGEIEEKISDLNQLRPPSLSLDREERNIETDNVDVFLADIQGVEIDAFGRTLGEINLSFSPTYYDLLFEIESAIKDSEWSLQSISLDSPRGPDFDVLDDKFDHNVKFSDGEEYFGSSFRSKRYQETLSKAGYIPFKAEQLPEYLKDIEKSSPVIRFDIERDYNLGGKAPIALWRNQLRGIEGTHGRSVREYRSSLEDRIENQDIPLDVNLHRNVDFERFLPERDIESSMSELIQNSNIELFYGRDGGFTGDQDLDASDIREIRPWNSPFSYSPGVSNFVEAESPEDYRDRCISEEEALKLLEEEIDESLKYEPAGSGTGGIPNDDEKDIRYFVKLKPEPDGSKTDNPVYGDKPHNVSQNDRVLIVGETDKETWETVSQELR